MTTNRILLILAVLLAGQIALTLLLNATAEPIDTPAAGTPLFTNSAEAITRIDITEPDGLQVSLLRADSTQAKATDGWLIEGETVPADTQRVESLLRKLLDLRASLPVATSESALQRFKVSEDEFERKVTLHGATNESLYLGSNRGVGEVHLRIAGTPAVHAAKLGLFEVPANLDAWYDKTLLAIPAERIASVSIGSLTLEKTVAANLPALEEAATGADPDTDMQALLGEFTGANWQLISNDKNTEQVVDQANVNELVRKLGELRFNTVATQEQLPASETDVEQTLVLRIKEEDDDTIILTIKKLKTDGQFLLHSSQRTETFILAGYNGESLLDAAEPDNLLVSDG